MRNSLRFVSLSTFLSLALAASLAGCADEPLPEDFETSREAWDQARDDADDTYTYVRFTQTFDGTREETTVSVSDGDVTHRSWTRSVDDAIVDSWDEVGADEVGTHEDGFAAATIDELYDLCGNDVLAQDGNDISITFETFSDGVLKNCYFVDQSVQDSGAEGVQLLSIELDVQSCGVAGGLGGKPCG